MKAALILITILGSFLKLHAQKSDDFVGDWITTGVELSAEAEEGDERAFQFIKKPFTSLVFHFHADKTFSMDSPNEDLSVKDGLWKYNEKEKKIIVTENIKAPRPGTILIATVKRQDERFYFQLEETPLILVVERKKL